MTYNRSVGQVSFNLDDPFEARLVAHAGKQGRFSKYVKRLIQRDLETAPGSFTAASAPAVDQEELEAMGSFL